MTIPSTPSTVVSSNLVVGEPVQHEVRTFPNQTCYQTDTSGCVHPGYKNPYDVTARALCCLPLCVATTLSTVGICTEIGAKEAMEQVKNKENCCIARIVCCACACGLGASSAATISVGVLFAIPVRLAFKKAREAATNSAKAKAAKAKAKNDLAQNTLKTLQKHLKSLVASETDAYKIAVRNEKKAIEGAITTATKALKSAQCLADSLDLDRVIANNKHQYALEKGLPSEIVTPLSKNLSEIDQALIQAQMECDLARKALKIAEGLKSIFNQEHPLIGKPQTTNLDKQKEEALQQATALTATSALAPLTVIKPTVGSLDKTG